MPGLQVTISQGILKGRRSTTGNGFKYNSYLGIPYAKPPIGDLRFKDPQPADGWSGIREAYAEGESCAHYDRFFSQKYMGEEDCLFVNVFTPATECHDLPVMFWIHGGGFAMGSGSQVAYGPDYLIQKDVIVVTVNYRLGALGFLCLHTPEVPGNAGLKDQILALKWVQKNIKQFGGNPNNVTIFGESAGAASVQYIMLSEMSKGLFHRAIMQSGSCLCTWSYQIEPELTALKLAKQLGYTGGDLLEFIRKIPTKDLIHTTDQHFKLNDQYNFTPTIEKKYTGVEAFMTSAPLDLLTSGKYHRVPTILGHTSEEGVIALSTLLFAKDDSTEKQVDFEVFLPQKIKSLNAQAKDHAILKIKSRYFSADKTHQESLIELMSDIGFIIDIDQSAKIMCRYNPVYLYSFNYNGSMNIFKYLLQYPYTGASHADELFYIFKPCFEKLIEDITSNIDPTLDDTLMINRMVEMWTNFAKFGCPTPNKTETIPIDWKPITENKMDCLQIDKILKVTKYPYAERVQFWIDLLKN